MTFIGAGRLARTVVPMLQAQGWPVSLISSRDPAEAQAAAETARLVWLTVSDDAIEALCRQLHWHPGQIALHCSGATERSVLAAAAAAGATTAGFHPLQIFSDPDSARVALPGSTVALECETEDEALLQAVARCLGLHPIRLPAGARARYHAAAGFAASFLLPALHEAVSLWQSFGLDEASALRALLPLARGTLDAVAARGTAGALSGPISRGDLGVIERHLQTLDALGPAHGALYRTLALPQLELARQAGRLSAEQIEALRTGLEAPRR
jgi:predicted short-subunit dehydrogenase-like oxidoreductase (DUF2520 family)